mgnify:CR=1 FL=1
MNRKAPRRSPMAEEEFEKWKKLVYKVVNEKFSWATSGEHKIVSRPFDKEDLIQEGFIALMKAWENYDPNHKSGAKFISYAYFIIRGNIQRWINNNLTPITTTNLRENKVGITKARPGTKQWESAKDRRNKMDLALKCRLFSDGVHLKTSKIYSKSNYRDDEFVTEKWEKATADMYDREESLENSFIRQDFAKDCYRILESHMSDGIRNRWLEVLMLRSDGYSFSEIGRKVGVSRERARQLNEKAMEEALKILKGYGISESDI